MSPRRTGSPARWSSLRWPLLSPLLLLATVAGGCSSTTKRDQFYGTDAGATYQPPEAGAFRDVISRDGADGGADAAHSEVAVGAGADAGGNTDTAVDAP
jgi:hypothetical protein